MRSSLIGSVVLALVALTACSRDPEVAKQRYLESGNKYYAMGKYKEARIRYRNALSKDMRFGLAYYKLGLTELKLGKFPEAALAFRRAIELKNTPADKRDAMVKLSDVYLVFGRDNKENLDEAEGYIKTLLKEDANSFDGHRQMGDLHFARAVATLKVANRTEGVRLLDLAIAEYRKANSIKPGDEAVMLQLARTVSGKGNWQEAADLFHRVLDKNKANAFGYAELYTLYMIQQQPQEAENVLKLAIQNNPKNYDYLSMLALHYSRDRRTEEMTNVLKRIKAGAKEFPDAYFVVGDFYLRLGDGESAIREYREGIAQDMKRKSSYQKRIIEVLMRQGKRNEAADLNAQILKDDPKDNDARGLAATFMMEKGDISHALIELQAVVTRAPDNAVARYNLGRAHAARGEWEQARQAFQKAIELRSDYMIARLALAQLQVTRGEYDAALKSAEQVLAFDRANISARMIQASALLGQKRFPESRALLEAITKVNPNYADAYFQMGVVNLMESKYREAEDSFRKAYQLNPANSRGLLGIVEAHLAQNQPEEALNALRTEIEKNPNRLDLRIVLGNTEVRAGKFDQGIADYQKAMEMLDKNSKERGQIFVRIGETYRRKGDYPNSIAQLQKAREYMPEDTTVLNSLGLSFDQGGRWSEAKQVYETVLKLDSNQGMALNNLAFLIAEHGGDLEDALSKAQRAKQLMPNLAEVSDTLGWIYVKKGQADAAIDILRDLVARVPANSTFRYHLAMALSAKGDKTRAIKELQEALKYNPTKEERQRIQEKLSQLSGGTMAYAGK